MSENARRSFARLHVRHVKLVVDMVVSLKAVSWLLLFDFVDMLARWSGANHDIHVPALVINGRNRNAARNQASIRDPVLYSLLTAIHPGL